MTDQAHGACAQAMIRIAQCQYVIIPGVQASHHHSHIIRLAPAVDKVGYLPQVGGRICRSLQYAFGVLAIHLLLGVARLAWRGYLLQ